MISVEIVYIAHNNGTGYSASLKPYAAVLKNNTFNVQHHRVVQYVQVCNVRNTGLYWQIMSVSNKIFLW